MPVTKVFQIKHTNKLGQTLEYIMNEAKTMKAFVDETSATDEHCIFLMDEGTPMKKLVSGHDDSFPSSPIFVYEDFRRTKMAVDALSGNPTLSDWDNPKRVIAHHIIQSFSPDDNLTAEEVHEIGRKTILELTGGNHQFVIATHMDKGHLHNHIIFNTTNSATLKKFRWQKGTKKSLEEISDKHAAEYGAKIIEPKLRNSYTDYSAWRSQNNFRYEIKEKLDFLKKHSTSLDDFLEKAKALNLHVDFSKKYATFRLTDSEQERVVRDRSLSKKGAYSLESIQAAVSGNWTGYKLDEIAERFYEQQAEKEDDFE